MSSESEDVMERKPDEDKEDIGQSRNPQTTKNP